MNNNNGLTLGEGEVHLWHTTQERLTETMIDQYTELLSADEVDHLDRLNAQEHRNDYLLSHALLRTTLSRYCDIKPAEWVFNRNQSGKPELAEQFAHLGLAFNLSHTEGMAICAVTRLPVIGVDIECHIDGSAMLEVADHYFSDCEMAELNALSQSEQATQFFRYWTLKEAFIKARGEGMTLPLADFSFSLKGDVVESFSMAETGRESVDAWRFRVIELGDAYTAAVAVKGEVTQTKLFNCVPAGQYQVNTLAA